MSGFLTLLIYVGGVQCGLDTKHGFWKSLAWPIDLGEYLYRISRKP